MTYGSRGSRFLSGFVERNAILRVSCPVRVPRIGVTALGARHRGVRRDSERLDPESDHVGTDGVEALAEIAREKDSTPARVALACLALGAAKGRRALLSSA
jgi:hypothetical protein